MNDTKTTVVIAAGGTGGHVFPGVAIAESVAEVISDADVVFVGTSAGPEARLIPQSGWEFVGIAGKSTHGGGFWNRLRTYVSVPRAIVSALQVLGRLRPDVVVGTGGYAVGPVVLAAALRRIPTAIIEPNAVAGRANRILARFVRRIFVGFARTARSFPSRKTIVTGNPVRRAVREADVEREGDGSVITVLCYGGSQGAQPLNRVMMDAAGYLAPFRDRVRIIHQVGTVDMVSAAAATYKRAEFEAEVFTFTERIADIYRETDVAVARSGAGTVAELAATRIPSVLVPLPHAVDDHQQANAEELAAMGGALLVKQAELTGERLATIIVDFLEHPEKLMLMREALRAAGSGGAADLIARECARMIRKAA